MNNQMTHTPIKVKFNYADVLENDEVTEYSKTALIETPEEIKQWNIKQLIEINDKMKPLNQQKKDVLISLFNPEKRADVIGLAINAGKNIVLSNTLHETEGDIVYKGFTDKEKDLLKSERGTSINNIYSIVTNDEVVKKGVEDIKEIVTYDSRKIRQNKKVGKTLDSLYLHKKLADNAERLRQVEEGLALLFVAQKENNAKFDQIGAALLGMENKFDALLKLGVDRKKVELYKLRLENPKMTQEELGNLIGKPRRTVIRWLKDLKSVQELAEIEASKLEM